MQAQRQTSNLRRYLRKALRLSFWGVLIGFMMFAGVASGVSWVVYDASSRLPSYDEIQSRPTGTTVRYFSADKVLLHSEGPQYGEWIEYTDIPMAMRRRTSSLCAVTPSWQPCGANRAPDQGSKVNATTASPLERGWPLSIRFPALALYRSRLLRCQLARNSFCQRVGSCIGCTAPNFIKR